MQLVERKLDQHPGELIPYAHHRYPTPVLSFEQHKAAAVRDMTKRFAGKRVALRTPPDPALISIKSWQYGFTDADDDQQAARSFADGLYLRLQAWRSAYLSSARWRAYLDAFDRPDRWLELGREAEADGWTIEANACFAAARWLDPATEAGIAELIAGRGPELPARLLRQPDPSFPTQPLGQRHWLAWDMKNYGHLDLPTLLRWECDRSFSIRTRIVRSLGQQPHPAAIQALQENTLDPHPFARAQAVRSLGWCADPTSEPLLRELAEHDPDAEVRRSAAKAIQRMLGYWGCYGEWNAITASPTRLLEVARVLVDEGLRAFVFELLCSRDMPGVDMTEVEALLDQLEPDALEPDQREDYGDHLAAAADVERTPEPSFDPAELYAVVDDPGERGFEARRTLRRLGLGTLAQRRLRLMSSLSPDATA